MRKAADQRRAVKGLELIELGAVDQAGDHFTHVIRLAQAGRHDAVQLCRVAGRFAHLAPRGVRSGRPQAADDPARDVERVGVVLRVVITDSRLAAMHVGAAE